MRNISKVDSYIDTKRLKKLFDSYHNEIDKYNSVKSIKLFEDMSEVNNPKITIVIPTYKRSDTLIEAINSVINQSIQNCILLILDNSGVNDPSVPQKLELIKNLNYHRIVYYVNEKNIGMTGNWNRCISLTKTSYMAMLHDDDLLDNCYVDKMSQLIDTIDNGNIGAVKAAYVNFSKVENITNHTNNKEYLHKYVNKVKLKDFITLETRVTNPPSCGTLFSVEALKKIGGFYEEYYPVADLVCQFLLLKNGYELFKCPIVMGYYRWAINESFNYETIKKTCALEFFVLDGVFSKNLQTKKIWNKISSYYYCYRIKQFNSLCKDGSIFNFDLLNLYNKFGFIKAEIYKIIRYMMRKIYGRKCAKIVF